MESKTSIRIEDYGALINEIDTRMHSYFKGRMDEEQIERCVYWAAIIISKWVRKYIVYSPDVLSFLQKTEEKFGWKSVSVLDGSVVFYFSSGEECYIDIDTTKIAPIGGYFPKNFGIQHRTFSCYPDIPFKNAKIKRLLKKYNLE